MNLYARVITRVLSTCEAKIPPEPIEDVVAWGSRVVTCRRSHFLRAGHRGNGVGYDIGTESPPARGVVGWAAANWASVVWLSRCHGYCALAQPLGGLLDDEGGGIWLATCLEEFAFP